MEEFRKKVMTCLQDEVAYCTAACPFNLDIRDFIEKMQRSSFNAAFRVYRNAVGFPSIVAKLCTEPCKNVCPRKDAGGAIEIKLLENSTINYANNINPTDYNMPFKNKKVAIIGAGISGLGCALRLTDKKYDVDIYEKTDRIGGHLWDVMESEVFLEDIKRQFMYSKYNLYLNTEIKDLDSLDYDAVYVATGKGGNDFGLLKEMSGSKYATKRQGVFIGGSVIGSDTMTAIADGLQIAFPIESYIKVNNMDDPTDKSCTGMYLDPYAMEYEEKIIPENNSDYTKEEAKKESKRCLRCICDSCKRHCDLMRVYNKYPKRLKDEVDATIYPSTLDGNGRIATRAIATCNQCGLCKEVCPEDIYMGDFLLKSRQEMHQKGSMPWSFHDFWIRDMIFTDGEYAHMAKLPKGYDKSTYMFFPGCQLGASDVRYVDSVYEDLLKYNPDTAIMLNCCGAPAIWAGDVKLHEETLQSIKANWIELGKPTAIFACPTCKQMFEKYLPDIKGIFLYDMLAERKHGKSTVYENITASVFDPCSSRYEQKLQQTVRQLSEMKGFKLQPIFYEGKMAQCCTWGGHISIANPGFVKQVVEKRISQNQNPYITYCVNCRDIFAKEGKPVWHILDIMYGLNDEYRKPPTVTERRLNRIKLKNQLIAKYWDGENMIKDQNSKFKINISEELKEKINNEMMIENDVKSVVEYCEESENKLQGSAENRFFGHKTVGFTTIWVEYEVSKLYEAIENKEDKIKDNKDNKDNNGNEDVKYNGNEDVKEIELINTYCHRMSIEEE